MHIHILGICGTFMGSLAILAQQAGHKVTGCDLNVYPPMSTQLEKVGIELVQGYSADQIKTINPDLFVIGNVVSRGNHLMEAVLNQGLKYQSGPQWLYENILQDKWVIGVAGTHGKTTTTSIVAWCLEFAGYNPSFLIGGVPLNFELSARLTDSPFFVIEADEYDTAFFDKRAKFVHYHPKTLILNNLEFDHADIYADISAIETQFHHLVRTIPQIGKIIVNQHSESLQHVVNQGIWSELEYFGNPSDFNFPESIVGNHNKLNAEASLKALQHVGVSEDIVLEALAEFKGVKRRLEIRDIINNIIIYDDFAHHPTAISETILALKSKNPKRILAVFEPRSNSMKLGIFKDNLASSFNDADAVFIYAPPNLGWNVEDCFNKNTHKNYDLNISKNIDNLIDNIKDYAQSGDAILIMSNGSFENLHNLLIDQLKS